MNMKKLCLISLVIALVSGFSLISCGEGAAPIHDIAILDATAHATNVSAGTNITVTLDIENRGNQPITFCAYEHHWFHTHLVRVYDDVWADHSDPFWLMEAFWYYDTYELQLAVPFQLNPQESVHCTIEWPTVGLCTGEYSPAFNVTTMLDPAITDANPDDNVAYLEPIQILNEEQPYEIDSLCETLRYFQTDMGAPDPMDIYVIYIDDEDGWEYRDDFAAAIVAANYTGHFNIVGQQSVAPGATDVTTELTVAQASGADVLCAFTYPGLTQVVLTQAIDLGINFDAMVLALGANSDAFYSEFGADTEGVIGFGAGEIPWCRWRIGQWQSGTFEVIAPPEEATASPVYPMP